MRPRSLRSRSRKARHAMTQTTETSRRLAREAYVNGYLTFDELDRVSLMIDRNELAAIRDLLIAAADRYFDRT
jgi:hypothetical protein